MMFKVFKSHVLKLLFARFKITNYNTNIFNHLKLHRKNEGFNLKRFPMDNNTNTFLIRA